MSVFRVKLQNPQQGRLDIDPTTGVAFTTSKQRTIFVAGPHRIYRKLFDGDTFTDNNYWKRFAYPQVALADAFIEVVTDDGSVYSDVEAENTFPLTYGGATALTIAHGDAYADTLIDIYGDYGSYAKFVQITNLGTASPDQDIKVKLNGSATAIFNLFAGDTQTFDSSDLLVSSLAFQGSGVSDTTLQVILSIKSPSNS